MGSGWGSCRCRDVVCLLFTINSTALVGVCFFLGGGLLRLLLRLLILFCCAGLVQKVPAIFRGMTGRAMAMAALAKGAGRNSFPSVQVALWRVAGDTLAPCKAAGLEGVAAESIALVGSSTWTAAARRKRSSPSHGTEAAKPCHRREGSGLRLGMALRTASQQRWQCARRRDSTPWEPIPTSAWTWVETGPGAYPAIGFAPRLPAMAGRAEGAGTGGMLVRMATARMRQPRIARIRRKAIRVPGRSPRHAKAGMFALHARRQGRRPCRWRWMQSLLPTRAAALRRSCTVDSSPRWRWTLGKKAARWRALAPCQKHASESQTLWPSGKPSSSCR
jgi:hypothetical protein